MSGTEIAYGAGVGSAGGEYWRPCTRYLPTRTDLAYGAISLRVCCAMSGTDLACGAISLRVCYAMSGTDPAYAPPSNTAPHRSASYL
eukprot:37248-Rhodomonas_salina.5